MNRLTWDGTAEPIRETKFSGTNGDKEILLFSVQLTTGRIGNLTRSIHTLHICDDHTYIHLYSAMFCVLRTIHDKNIVFIGIYSIN